MAETSLNVCYPSIVLCTARVLRSHNLLESLPYRMLNISRFASKLRNLWVNSTKEGITLNRSVSLPATGLFKTIFLKTY